MRLEDFKSDRILQACVGSCFLHHNRDASSSLGDLESNLKRVVLGLNSFTLKQLQILGLNIMLSYLAFLSSLCTCISLDEIPTNLPSVWGCKLLQRLHHRMLEGYR
ncbi:unnamed protein product [Linum tenue]|uniref:Uncharacterized protein n=1 Tax=Linum tenue TaxID=586396 RepID=A0AAV0NPT1_9ROSI|nr:unnamed protein product [Linum tenue]